MFRRFSIEVFKMHSESHRKPGFFIFSLYENIRDCTPYSPEGGAESCIGFEAGRIHKEGGASRSESYLTIAGGNRSMKSPALPTAPP